MAPNQASWVVKGGTGVVVPRGTYMGKFGSISKGIMTACFLLTSLQGFPFFMSQLVSWQRYNTF